MGIILQAMAIGAIFAVAAGAQAASGFGFALLAVPLLSVLVGPTTAVVAMAVAGFVLQAFMAVRDHSDVRRTTVSVVVVAALAGMPLGLLVITNADPQTLRILIAVVVLTFTLLLWRGLTLPDRPATDASAGFVSGVLSTSTGTNGPPLVIAFQGKGLTPPAFRATLAATFLIQGGLALAGFAVTGLVTREALLVAAVGLPGIAVGWWGGQRVFQRMDHERFRRVVLAMLGFSGLLTLISAVVRGA
jgi:uncharacterized membrane protein YfcA